MSDFITTKAYAKVNLHLAVGKKATDGFHQIVSLFHKISLYDEIQIEVNKEAYSANIIVEMLGGPLVEQKDNLAYKAAALFYKNYQAVNSHTKGECKIKIVKNIPSGAGLGGGSSDAASVLMALNEIYNFPFSVGLLTQMATTLGSDLPFFFCEEAALVTGKGEKVKAYKSKEKPYILLAFPNVSINTKKAYSWVDEDKAYLEELEPQKRFLCSLVDKQLVWDNSFFNSFEITKELLNHNR